MTRRQQASKAKKKGNSVLPRKRLLASRESIHYSQPMHLAVLQQTIQNPQAAQPQTILQLQQMVGNRTVQRLVAQRRQITPPRIRVHQGPSGSVIQAVREESDNAWKMYHQEFKTCEQKGREKWQILQNALRKASPGKKVEADVKLPGTTVTYHAPTDIEVETTGELQSGQKEKPFFSNKFDPLTGTITAKDNFRPRKFLVWR